MWVWMGGDSGDWKPPSLNFSSHCLLQQVPEPWGELSASPAASEVDQLEGMF